MLLDAYGRPVRTARLTRPAAEPGLAGIRQLWDGSTAAGLTPRRLAAVLMACDQGDIRDYLVLAEEMEERDPHYASVLGTRKRVVSGVAPRVEPASEDAEDVRIADEVRNRIAEHEGFADLVEDLLDALGKGFAAVEIDWERSARDWSPRRFLWRDPRWFRFDRETGRELRLLDDTSPVDGVPLEPFKFMVHLPRLKSGLPVRGGLARLVAFSWMCKAYALKDWVAFAETYGLPLRLGRYGPEATRDDVAALFTAVANIGTDAAAVLPKSMEIEFQDAAKGTSDQLFEGLARFMDQQVSKAVLGQTMTADDGASLAQAKVHNEVRHDIAAADARQITGTLNRDLVRPFVDLNFGVRAAYPRLIVEVAEPEDTVQQLGLAAQLMPLGLRVRASELRAKAGLSDPEPDDEVVGGMPAAAAAPAAPPVAANSALPQAAPSAGPDAALEELEAELLADWDEVMSETLDPVIAAVEGAGSAEEALERLAALEALPTARIIDRLVRGMFAARALGDARDD